jgi:hypothetical protein
LQAVVSTVVRSRVSSARGLLAAIILTVGIVGLDYFGCTEIYLLLSNPDAGGVYRAKKFKEGLEQESRNEGSCLAMIVKQRSRAGSVDQMDLVGDVRDYGLLVDDMVDTGWNSLQGNRCSPH